MTAHKEILIYKIIIGKNFMNFILLIFFYCKTATVLIFRKLYDSM